MEKEASSQPEEIRNQVAKGRHKQLAGGRTRTKLISCLLSLIPLLKTPARALWFDLKGEEMEEEMQGKREGYLQYGGGDG